MRIHWHSPAIRILETRYSARGSVEADEYLGNRLWRCVRTQPEPEGANVCGERNGIPFGVSFTLAVVGSVIQFDQRDDAVFVPVIDSEVGAFGVEKGAHLPRE